MELTIVDGEILMEDGEVTAADAAAIRQETTAVADSLDLEAARGNAREFKP